MTIEIKREDYAEWDWDAVVWAGGDVMRVVADIAFHNTNPGEGWQPFAKINDTPELIAEVRGHIECLEEAIKKARKGIADVERNARLAAGRRVRKEKKEAEENR